MAKSWHFRWPIAVLLFASLALSTDAGACRNLGCSKTGSSLFQYAAGQTYTYSLEGVSLASLPEQQGDGVKVELRAQADVHFGADCANSVQLRDVSVTGPSAKKYALKDLEAHALKFSFSEAEVCADADDSNTALNLKRAVISLLQVSTPQTSGSASKHETDVFGVCPTDFVLAGGSGGETVVTKSRNLNRCAHREDLRQRILSTPYVSEGDLQSSPLLDSQLAVEQRIKAGIIQSAESKETYLYRPFANKEAGARTVIVTKLTLVSHAAGPAHKVSKPVARSLVFDAPHGDSTASSSKAAVEKALTDAGAAMPAQAGVGAATEFRHLVDALRGANKDDLLLVYAQVKAGAGVTDKKSARKLFLDALFRAGTGDSVQVAVELLKSAEISGDVAVLWYTSFGFVRHATLASLTAAATLLDAPSAPRAAYLGVGALAGRFCHQHACAGVPQLDALLAKLATPLAKGCSCANHEEEDRVIAALKGLENVRQLNEATAQLLRVCVTDPKAPARVRVAALEAFRADSCQPQLKKTALELLKDVQEDSEIRIKAYLAAVECPCGPCANTLKELLDTEPVNQVGSFIVSHLRNIRASKNPDNANAKHHLSQVRSSKRFPEDIRRYSHNREFSYFLDAANLGGSVERSVIYSQQSWLPRSTNLNLTAQVFGHSVNLLEIGTRAQNLDRVVEAYFGPRGYFRSTDLEQLLGAGKTTLQGLKDKLKARFDKSFRSRRSVPAAALDAFRQQVSLVNDHQDIDLDLNVKLFGNTVLMRSYHGAAHALSPERVVDSLFDCLDNSIDKAKEFNYDLKQHGLFLDTELSYPTGLGFPLTLAVTGSSAVHLKLDGKVDLKAILKDPKNAHVQFEIVPSASVEVTGSLFVDAHALEAGLTLAAVLHTSTGFNVDARAVEGGGLDVTLGLPLKKQDIVTFKSDLLTSVRERGHAPVETAVSIVAKRKDYHGCFDQLSPLVGLTFCGEVGVPMEGVNSKAALFPLNGPARLHLSVESDDVTTYKFRLARTEEANGRKLQLLVDTPNSKTNRKVELLLEGRNKPNREVRVTLNSPYKTASAELVLANSEKEVSLSGKFVNDGQEYVAKLGAEVSGAEAQRTYKPLLEYSLPGGGKPGKKSNKKAVKPDYHVEGSVTVDKSGDSKKLTFNNVVFTVPAGKLALNGWVATDATSVSSDLKLEHDNANSLLLKGKLAKLGPAQFAVDAEVLSSTHPDLGVSLKWDYHRAKEQLDSNLVLVHGKDLTSAESRLTASLLAKYTWVSAKEFSFSGKGKATYPLLGVDGHVEGSADPKSLSYELDGTYDKHKVQSALKFKHSTNAPRDYDLEFEAKVLDSGVKFASHRAVVSESENKFATSLELTPGGRYELNADVTCHSEPGAALRKLLLVAKIAGTPDAYTLDTGLEANAQVFNAHVKATVGSKALVDVSAKLNKGANPNGSFKVLLTDQVDGAGTFKYTNGAGALAATVDLKKLNRKVKVSGELAVTGSSHVGSLDVFPDFDKDPARKIHFSTNTDARKGFLDTRNTLVVLDYTTVLNGKMALEGKLTDGHLVANGDLTLPNGRVFTAKVDRVLHLRDVDSEVDAKGEVTSAEKAGAPARSVQWAVKGSRLNVKKAVFDAEVDVTYSTAGGKNVNYHVVGQSLPSDGKHLVELKAEVKGSLLELAPLLHVKAELGKPLVTYFVKLHLAGDSNLELSGKCQKAVDAATPYLMENDLNLSLPTGELKNVRVAEKWSFLRAQDGAPCKLEGWTSVTYNTDKSVKLELDLAGTKMAGAGTATLHFLKDEPRVLKGSFKVDKSAGVTREGELTLTRGDKESHVALKVAVPEAKDAVHVTLDARTPLERLRTLKVVFDGARLASTVETKLVWTRNDKTVELTTKRGVDVKRPQLELSLTYPNGKTLVAFHFLRKELADSEFEGALQLEHAGNALSAKLDARAPSPHDFDVTLHLDSAKLNLDKVVVTLSNKPGGAKGGKALKVTRTDNGQVVVTGTLDYHFEDGSNGVLYEATGNLQVRGESRAAKISVTRHVISLVDETGLEVKFFASLGDASTEALYKRSNKQVHLLAKRCKSAAECGHVEFLSALKTSGTRGSLDAEWQSDVTLDVDTTPLGGVAKVSFKAVAERKAKSLLHTAELRTKAGELYKSKLSVTDKEAELVLNTPAREVAAEAKYHVTVDAADKRHVTWKYEASAWLDRVREPTLKSAVTLDGELTRADAGLTLSTEARFTHPALGKDLLVKSKTVLGGRQVVDSVTEFDVFAKKGQKILVDAKILKNEINGGWNVTAVLDVKSKGQNLDISAEAHAAGSLKVLGFGALLAYKDVKQVKKDVGFGLQGTASNFVFFLKSPAELLVHVDAAYKMDDNQLPVVKAVLEVVGCQTVVGEAHVEKDFKLVYSVYKQATPDRKLVGVTQLDPSSKALASADWLQGKDTKPLWNVALSWGKAGKPEVSYSLDNIKALLEQTRGDVQLAAEKLKSAGAGLATESNTEVNDLIDSLKKAQPNLKPLLAAYQTQLKAIRAEIADDAAVKELSDWLKKVIGTATELTANFSEAVAKVAEKAVQVFEELSNAVLASLKRVVPAVTQSVNKVFQVGVDVVNSLANQLLVGLQRLVELIKKHEAEFKQLVTIVSELARDAARVVGKAVTSAWHEVRDFLSVIVDQLKALPAYSMLQERVAELKEQLKEYQVPEQLFETLKEVKGGLVDSLPTPPLQEFVTALFDYIEAVLRKKPQNDLEQLRNVLRKLVEAVRSVVALVRKEIGAERPEDLATVAWWPLSLQSLARLPLFAAVHLSPVDWFRSDDLPSLKQLFYTYRPTLNPLDFLPPFKSYGILVDTSHFFTLDGRHLTLASCGSVLLAQDVVNGNFSLVLNLEGGKFKSLQLSDQQDTVEIVAGGTLLHNGKPHELPLRAGGISAWRRYHSVNLRTNAGVHVKVDADHHFAMFYVSGFYHGQLRGVLGDLNNEPFDDLRLPSGKVTSDLDELRAAYALGPKCAQPVAHAHGDHAHHEDACTALFSSNSPLRNAFPVVCPKSFREACDHLLSETADKKAEFSCRIAAAYVEAARAENVKVDVPASCGSCPGVSGQPIAVGETRSVTSSGAADVIVIVEQLAPNAEVYKELVAPLVTQLQKELKDKAVSDVHVSLLGYGGPAQKWPVHYTSAGRLAFDAKTELTFDAAPTTETQSTRRQQWDALLHKLAVEVGRFKLRDAIVEAASYPFRAGATRAVILVTSSPCEKSALPFGLQKLRLLYAQKELRDRGISFHVVSQLAGLEVAGTKDAKTLKAVVGLDSVAVYSLGDAKKKPLEGNADMRKDVEFNADICVETALNSGGAAFSAANFLDSKANQRKSFIAVVARRVADSLDDDVTADCTCALLEGVHAQARCKVTSRQPAGKQTKG